MNRRRVEYFLTAAETLNLTETAERHFITQASISGAISALEEEIGFLLFDRSRKKLKLTPAGAYFYEACQNLVEIEDSYIQRARYISTHESHTLTIGTSHGFCFSSVNGLLHDFKVQNPDTEFHFISMDNDALAEQVKNYCLDAAFTFQLEGIQKDCLCRELLLGRSRYGVLVPRGHALEDASALSPEQLKGQDILYPTNYTSDAPASLAELNRAGIFPTKILKGWTLDQIMMTATVDRSLVLIAEFFVTALSYLDYVFIPFQQQMYDVELSLITPQPPVRPIVERLWDFFRSEMCPSP